MKTFAAFGIALALSSSALAADCQNLAGKFFYANNPSQSVTIEQTGCVLSMVYENSGNIGKPVHHLGDGVWRITHESKYEKETQASMSASDVYVVETLTEQKRTDVTYHLIENYHLRADGNIMLKSVIRSGDISDSATRLLIRE